MNPQTCIAFSLLFLLLCCVVNIGLISIITIWLLSNFPTFSSFCMLKTGTLVMYFKICSFKLLFLLLTFSFWHGLNCLHFIRYFSRLFQVFIYLSRISHWDIWSWDNDHDVPIDIRQTNTKKLTNEVNFELSPNGGSIFKVAIAHTTRTVISSSRKKKSRHAGENSWECR